MTRTWNKSSWRNHEAQQMPVYTDAAKLEAVTAKLSSYPPLVFAGEARRLTAELAEVAERRAFLLQGGDSFFKILFFLNHPPRKLIMFIVCLEWVIETKEYVSHNCIAYRHNPKRK